MNELAVKLRCMQLYAHNAHNACKGDTFYTDHEELGDLYGLYTGLYDGVIERMIGLGQSVDLIKIQTDAVKMLEGSSTPTSFSAAFDTILSCEKELCELLNKANEGASLGTQDLLQGMCNDSEVRQYKLKQRLGKSSETKEAAAEVPAPQPEKEATDKNEVKPFKLLTSKN